MKNKTSPVVTKISTCIKTMELGNLLGQKGTIEILHLLEERPKKYTELETTLNLSHTSLLRRLTLLQTLDMVKKQPIRSKRRETHEYDLTLRGNELMKFINLYEKTIILPKTQQRVIEISQ
jgi:DNA-binding HxlR family transcriptional regulator